MIPSETVIISVSAFQNNQITGLSLGWKVERIMQNAFDNNQEDPEDLIIYGFSGSAAENYAVDNNHTFLLYLDDF